jgi:hypothetical protein
MVALFRFQSLKDLNAGEGTVTLVDGTLTMIIPNCSNTSSQRQEKYGHCAYPTTVG